MTTKAYDAKGALIDLLQAQTGPSLPLDGVDVRYGFEANVGLKSIYGGGHRFEQQDAVAERGVLVRELVTVSLYLRALQRPSCDPRITDQIVEGMGVALTAVLKANPTLAGSLTWVGIDGGQGDYSRTDDETISVLAYRVQFGAHLTW